MSKKMTVEELRTSVDERFVAVERLLGNAVFPSDVEQDDDLSIRSDAVREATLRLKVLLEQGKGVVSSLVTETSDAFVFDVPEAVTQVLRIASFLLAEPEATANVFNYHDHYHVAPNSSN